MLLKLFDIEVIYFFGIERATLKSLQELLLDSPFNLCGLLGTLLPRGLSLFVLLVDRYELLLRVHVADPQLPLPDYHLMQLCQSLLALVTLELRPEF